MAQKVVKVEPISCYNRLMRYSWQQPDWPQFQYALKNIEDLLLSFAEKEGHVSGILKALPEDTQTEAIIDMMVAEAIKTSEIEGEYLSRRDVMSSIKNNLGLNQHPERITDKKAQGAAELMIDVRKSVSETLTEDTLFSWHTMIMRGNTKHKIGAWRTHEEPMQVVSGAIGKWKVHFEAPPSARVPQEMKQFIQWFNDTQPGGPREIRKSPVRSAIAHLYFETIHPFEDGNGRIGRALSEKALSQGVGRPILLSLSKTIEGHKNAYYDALKEAQKSLKITSWIHYFVSMALDAQMEAGEQIDFTLRKTKFFARFQSQLNDRQLRVIRRILEEGPRGFEGGMSPRKYIVITGTSKPTATRDLQELVEKGVLISLGAGRGRNYHIKL
jgi:Fic family protein